MKIIYYPHWKTVYYCQDKNASTTLKQFLDEQSTQPPVMYWDESTIRPSPPSLLTEILEQPIEFKFTIVRNTWDRISSLFHMLKGQTEKEYEGKPKGRLHHWFSRYEELILACLNSPDPFDQFVEFVCGQSDVEADSHWQSQTTHLPFDDPTLHIANFENLQDEWLRISESIGISEATLPISNNQTSHIREHFSQDYSRRSAAQVRKRYSAEIEQFGFEFESISV